MLKVTAVFAVVLVSVLTAVTVMLLTSNVDPSPSISCPNTDSFLPIVFDQVPVDQSSDQSPVPTFSSFISNVSQNVDVSPDPNVS